MQVSGIRYTYDASKQGLDRLITAEREDGTPIEPEKLYTVIMPDFIAAGGDGAQDAMKAVPRDRIQVSFAAPIRDVMVEQLRSDKPLVPGQVGSRITVLNAPVRH